jgi:hypothetical protein
LRELANRKLPEIHVLIARALFDAECATPSGEPLPMAVAAHSRSP